MKEKKYCLKCLVDRTAINSFKGNIIMKKDQEVIDVFSEFKPMLERIKVAVASGFVSFEEVSEDAKETPAPVAETDPVPESEKKEEEVEEKVEEEVEEKVEEKTPAPAKKTTRKRTPVKKKTTTK